MNTQNAMHDNLLQAAGAVKEAKELAHLSGSCGVENLLHTALDLIRQADSKCVDDDKLNDLRAKLSAQYSSDPEFADAASTAVSSTQLYGKPESARASYCQGHPDSIGE